MKKFFTGKVLANGYMVFFYPIKRIKKVKVLFSGSIKNNILALEESYYEDNIKTSTRNWYFEKLSNHEYIVSEKNIIKAI